MLWVHKILCMQRGAGGPISFSSVTALQYWALNRPGSRQTGNTWMGLLLKLLPIKGGSQKPLTVNNANNQVHLHAVVSLSILNGCCRVLKNGNYYKTNWLCTIRSQALWLRNAYLIGWLAKEILIDNGPASSPPELSKTKVGDHFWEGAVWERIQRPVQVLGKAMSGSQRFFGFHGSEFFKQHCEVGIIF